MRRARPYLEAKLLAQDAAVHRLDDGVLIQVELQRFGRAAGAQQGLMGVRLLEALHQPGPVGTRGGTLGGGLAG